jgi:hypothetical protein
MRINEVVTRAETIAELRIRTEQVAALCDTMSDIPLLFREFSTYIKYETLIARVDNFTADGGRARKYVKRGSSGIAQESILDLLGIENPVFVTMSPPVSIYGFHGDSHIFIPTPGSHVVWSPEIADLGGQQLRNGVSLGHKDLGGGMIRNTPGVMEKNMMRWASTYKTGYPDNFTTHELIFDCKYYYLVNIKSLLSKFAGKENQSMISISKIDPLFSMKFKNYGALAWYLRNTVPKYLDWFQQEYPRAI